MKIETSDDKVNRALRVLVDAGYIIPFEVHKGNFSVPSLDRTYFNATVSERINQYIECISRKRTNTYVMMLAVNLLPDGSITYDD